MKVTGLFIGRASDNMPGVGEHLVWSSHAAEESRAPPLLETFPNLFNNPVTQDGTFQTFLPSHVSCVYILLFFFQVYHNNQNCFNPRPCICIIPGTASSQVLANILLYWKTFPLYITVFINTGILINVH